MIFGPGPVLLRTAAGRQAPTQGSAPASAPVALSHQGMLGISLVPPSCSASARLSSLANVLPVFQDASLGSKKEENSPLQQRPPKDLGKHPLLLNILNCASWCQPLPLSLQGHWAAFQGQPESKSVWCQGERGMASSPPSPQRADPPFHRGQEERKSWGPQSSAPSSSVWGAPGGSSGSGVCSPK